ncbi:hypothetical protein HO133_002325 [Letharia lupina]|uniref:Defect at low temperature protein 1 n=1 Tax=Letharia lupina TaxID=560253 RepID=A0A8H6CDX5_9LECA|nr:uncharacterized protein HO133_002325 [Letharia lupina]KAF6221469.1 hypothetical protein HO133_002325 [Letharia lupina]
MHIPHPHHHIPFFRIWYSTTFTVLSLVLASLLLVTPGDHIYESFTKGEIFHIFIVAGLYLLTFLIAVFIYAGRLYAARSALAGIPKEVNWGEDPGRVGREIRKGLARSADVSYESHPRDLRDEKAARGLRKKARLGRTAEGRQSPDTVTGFEPAWGVISHPGWSSPCSPDLPNLHYEPVVRELSHLIEAKAVSLAPSDPLSSYEPDLNLDGEEEDAEAPIPDPVAVELLQRPASMGLRDYLSHLATVGMVDLEPLASDFVARYEYARYSGEELDEGDFRALMGVFAEILRGMRPLDVGIVDEVRAEMAEAMSGESEDGDGAGYRDAESINTTETVRRTPQPETYSASSSSSPSSSSSLAGSRSGSQGTIHTAPSRPVATRNPSSRSRRSAKNRSVHQPSLSSLRRVRTDTSSSGYSARSRAGSVIRLKEASGPLDLPYAIITGDGEEL